LNNDLPLESLHDPAARREPESGALPFGLGRKEGIKCASQDIGRHPLPGVRNREHHLGGRDLRPDSQLTAPGHGVVRVEGQVEEQLFELCLVRPYHRGLFRRHDDQGNPWNQHACEHQLSALHDGVQVPRREHQRRVACKGEQTPRQRSRPLRRQHRRAQLRRVWGAGSEVRGHEIEIAQDRGQQVVEVMRDSARQLTESVHLLGPRHTLLRRQQRALVASRLDSIGDVAHDRHHAGFAFGRQTHLHPLGLVIVVDAKLRDNRRVGDDRGPSRQHPQIAGRVRIERLLQGLAHDVLVSRKEAHRLRRHRIDYPPLQIQLHNEVRQGGENSADIGSAGAQALVRCMLFRDVAQRGDDLELAVSRDGAERHVDGKLAPISGLREQPKTTAQTTRLRIVEVADHLCLMSVAQLLRKEQPQRLADQVGACVAKESLSLPIEIADHATPVDEEQGVRRSLYECHPESAASLQGHDEAV